MAERVDQCWLHCFGVSDLDVHGDVEPVDGIGTEMFVGWFCNVERAVWSVGN